MAQTCYHLLPGCLASSQTLLSLRQSFAIKGLKQQPLGWLRSWRCSVVDLDRKAFSPIKRCKQTGQASFAFEASQNGRDTRLTNRAGAITSCSSPFKAIQEDPKCPADGSASAWSQEFVAKAPVQSTCHYLQLCIAPSAGTSGHGCEHPEEGPCWEGICFAALQGSRS